MKDSADKKPEGEEKAPAGESIGRYLARERELRGMSLEQVADETRIGASNLRALEQDDQKRLPARVFVLGYIRAYAQAIGLNPDEAVLRYEEQVQHGAPTEKVALMRRGSRPLAPFVIGALLVAGAVAFFFLRRGH